jgi:hypothetical protein
MAGRRIARGQVSTTTPKPGFHYEKTAVFAEKGIANR